MILKCVMINYKKMKIEKIAKSIVEFSSTNYYEVKRCKIWTIIHKKTQKLDERKLCMYLFIHLYVCTALKHFLILHDSSLSFYEMHHVFLKLFYESCNDKHYLVKLQS